VQDRDNVSILFSCRRSGYRDGTIVELIAFLLRAVSASYFISLKATDIHCTLRAEDTVILLCQLPLVLNRIISGFRDGEFKNEP
jgi:hypothetical protein